MRFIYEVAHRKAQGKRPDSIRAQSEADDGEAGQRPGAVAGYL